MDYGFPLYLLFKKQVVCVVFFCGVAYWTSWQSEGGGSHVAVAALQELSAQCSWCHEYIAHVASWETGGMDALPYSVSFGQSVHLQDPLKRGTCSSVCLHVGIRYSGQFWNRSEEISGFKLHISL